MEEGRGFRGTGAPWTLPQMWWPHNQEGCPKIQNSNSRSKGILSDNQAPWPWEADTGKMSALNILFGKLIEKEMATYSNILAWKILWTVEPEGLLSIGSHRVGHNWSDLACMNALEKEMSTHSNILAWRIPGTEQPGGLPSVGSHRVGHDWSDAAAANPNF